VSIDVDKEMLKKAKGYALRLFKLRPRSTAELRDKLAGKEFSPEVIEVLVQDLTARRDLDDAAFARAWVQGRITRYGRRRLDLELTQKGISGEIVQALWQDIGGDYDEEAQARGIAGRRAGITRDKEPLKREKRVMDYLARRGFSMGTITKVLKDL